MSARNWVRAGTIAAAVFALSHPALTQTKGLGTTTTGSSGTASGSGTTTSRAGMDPNSTTTSSPSNPSGNASAPPPAIVLSGRVMLEDGTPPPPEVVIERVCNGSARAEGYADTDGYFVVQLGAANTQFQDASESAGRPGALLGGPFNAGGLGSGAMSGMSTSSTGRSNTLNDVRLGNCEIRARLAGYRSQTVSLIDRRPLDDPNIGTILLHRLAPDEGPDTVSAADLAVPKPANKAYLKGLNLLKKGKSADAEESFQNAVKLCPQFSSAWLELGKLQALAGHTEDAHKSFLAANRADPHSIAPYLELSLFALHDRNWKDLADLTYHALEINSFDYPQAFFMNGVANYNLRRLDSAEKSARSALRLDTRHIYPENSRLLGAILLDRRKYAEGAEALREYLAAVPNSPQAPAIRQQLADLEKGTVLNAQVGKQ